MSRPEMDRAYSYEPNDETVLSAQRQPNYTPYRDDSPSRHMQTPHAGYQYEAYTPSASAAPTPPLHRQNPFSDSNANLAYAPSTHSTTTPGMDNLGERSAGGGIAGIAYGVAGQNERESGVQETSQYLPNNQLAPDRRMPPVGAGTEAWTSNHHDQAGMPLQYYPAQPVNSDTPYNKRYSSPWDSRVDQNAFDPNDIEDDGDDGLGQRDQRRSMLRLGRSGQSSNNNLAAGGVVAGATGASAAGTASPAYGPLTRGGSGNIGNTEKGFKAAESRRRKKRMCFIILGIIILIVAIAGAVVGGVLGSRDHSKDKSVNNGGESASDDDGKGDLTKDSAEIKKLMNDKDLHMVFPGIDYTPFNAQYPACITNPPSQNNVTRDIAVISQLTKVVRLYGTDCNQTDMVLHSMDQLGLDDMKVWLGVWLDKNKTTNARGMRDMYDILDRNGQDRFAGVIIGNEILFREDMTVTQLADVVGDVKSNFTDKKIDLPIGVADLGDNWRKDGPEFIKSVDVVMSNIHPFFAGVTADKGAGWTWDFWQQNDVALTTDNNKKNIISEVGWPSEGGNSCGEGTCTSKTQGSVAGIDEMNTFMEDFVCQSLKNGTDYFWFEIFDEPWKVQFNKDDENWEDRWGLMTPDRKIKPGLKIPDCDGKTIST